MECRLFCCFDESQHLLISGQDPVHPWLNRANLEWRVYRWTRGEWKCEDSGLRGNQNPGHCVKREGDPRAEQVRDNLTQTGGSLFAPCQFGTTYIDHQHFLHNRSWLEGSYNEQRISMGDLMLTCQTKYLAFQETIRRVPAARPTGLFRTSISQTILPEMLKARVLVNVNKFLWI